VTPLVDLTIATEFNAAHMLLNPALTREENTRTFGECANPAGHGHLFRVEITLSAPVSPERPYVATRGWVRRIIDDVLSPRFKDGFLNTAFGHGVFVPTGENLAKAVWGLVEAELDAGVSLTGVRIVETRKNSFRYLGGDAESVKGSVT
jgi:6-pyruvoyltetrahydropterin/6-carboxytetrahydropterin synthase